MFYLTSKLCEKIFLADHGIIMLFEEQEIKEKLQWCCA